MGTIALNKLVAVEKGVKSTTYRRVTDLHKASQNKGLLQGLARTYEPKTEDGQTFPPETHRLQVRVPQLVEDLQASLVRLFDVVATKDEGNTSARADVEVDGQVLIPACPVTTLLFLEKQLSDLKTFVEKLPTLDPAEEWTWDDNQDCYATKPVKTLRETKVPKVITKAEATKEHPAQVDVYMDTEVVGTWHTIKYSGAVSATRTKALLERIEALQRAVKYAREEANQTEVQDKHIGETILSWIFAE